MEIETIAKVLAFIVGLISSLEFIIKRIDKLLVKKLDPLISKQNEEHLQRLKIDLIMYMALADQNLLDYHLRELAYETYDEYTNLGGNTYIHTYWERLKSQNKL